MPPSDHQTWIETFRQLLQYYVPPLEPTPGLVFGSLAVALAGLFLAFRSAKFERLVVCIFALLLGGWIGWRLSIIVGTPGPISMAVVGVALTALAYRTYKFWLASGSVIVVFCLAMTLQLGRGDLKRYIPTIEQRDRQIREGLIQRLPSTEEQLRQLHPQVTDQIAKIKERIAIEMQSLGPMGWLVPIAGAIIGGLLAYWTLRVFVVVWLGLVGSLMTVLGGTTFLCAQWPSLRTSILSEPRVPAGIVLGLWLLGLILQAKDARLPARKEKPAPAGKPATQE
jgi:hypothetical protein